MIDYENETLDIIEPPDRDIRFIDSCFISTDGFSFVFQTVRTFLKNRGITADTKTGVYYNVDSDTKIVVIRKGRI